MFLSQYNLCYHNLLIIFRFSYLWLCCIQRDTHSSHYLNKRWHIVSRTVRNKVQWTMNKNSKIFKKSSFQNAVNKIASILFIPQYFKEHIISGCDYFHLTSINNPAHSWHCTHAHITNIPILLGFYGIICPSNIRINHRASLPCEDEST